MKIEQKVIRYIINNIRPAINLKNFAARKNILFKSKNTKKLDPFTIYDLDIEKIIKKKINNVFPSHQVIGEETKTKKISSKFKWIIDPIDGTKVFILGLPTWSNLIGFLISNKPKIGFANFPHLQKYYFSDGKNSYVSINNKKKKIFANKKKDLSKAKLVTNSIHTFKNSKYLNFFRKYKYFF